MLLQDPSLLSDQQQQVFTIDTGMGNCDTSGMPTLADASLAETAARLQQVQLATIYRGRLCCCNHQQSISFDKPNNAMHLHVTLKDFQDLQNYNI